MYPIHVFGKGPLARGICADETLDATLLDVQDALSTPRLSTLPAAVDIVTGVVCVPDQDGEIVRLLRLCGYARIIRIGDAKDDSNLLDVAHVPACGFSTTALADKVKWWASPMYLPHALNAANLKRWNDMLPSQRTDVCKEFDTSIRKATYSNGEKQANILVDQTVPLCKRRVVVPVAKPIVAVPIVHARPATPIKKPARKAHAGHTVPVAPKHHHHRLHHHHHNDLLNLYDKNAGTYPLSVSYIGLVRSRGGTILRNHPEIASVRHLKAFLANGSRSASRSKSRKGLGRKSNTDFTCHVKKFLEVVSGAYEVGGDEASDVSEDDEVAGILMGLQAA